MAKKNFIVVYKSGGEYSVDHVFRLYNQIDKNITGDYKIYCLTDTNYAFRKVEHSRINFVPLYNNFPGWWSKIELFSWKQYFHGLKNLLDEKIIYFDLDTSIVGNIDFLFDKINRFTVLSPLNPERKADKICSGMLGWHGKPPFFIYDEFMNCFKRIMIQNRSGGDQVYLNSIMEEYRYIPDYFQKIYPNTIYSYKYHCQNGIPDSAKIILFHGKPKPWELS